MNKKVEPSPWGTENETTQATPKETKATKTSSSKVVKAETKTDTKAEAKTTDKAADKAGAARFVVQVGTFSDDSKVKEVRNSVDLLRAQVRGES